MSFNERRKAKSKSPSRNKKTQPRFEAIKVTIERKKKCNDKALQIVTEFSDGTITENELLENLKYINQEHYQDIIEERAINKLCGYPLCSKQLKNIPSKQYHISTTHNKVFDITDRKNFCSNLCYKASKFLKDQVSTSPLWLREDEVTTFKLISLQSNGGISGDEVDLGVSPVKLEPEDILTTESRETKDESSLEVLNELNVKENITAHIGDIKNVVADECLVENDISNVVSQDVNNLFVSKNNLESASEQCLNKETLIEVKDQHLESDRFETLPEKNNSSEVKDDCDCQPGSVTPKGDVIISNPTSSKTGSSLLNSLISDSQTKSKPHRKSSKRNPSSDKSKSNHTNPIHNVVLKIEKILREWISLDSLCFILGEEKIKETLADKKNKNLPAFTNDIHLYERYQAICKKLSILELEDTKIDASFRDEAKKPLPDYETLKEETRQMEIKVRRFFKGDKVQFEESEVNNESKNKSDAVDVEPVLPLVDVHAQKALRRRIVNDKLRKVLQDLQKSLGLRGFNLIEDVRRLVGTLTLSAHNITMKPAEWNLVSIAVIKLLSLRDSLLAQALTSATASRHLTLLLMSYSLDAGYLDRLMVWLTDVDAVIKST